jgi:hypothetical protein
MYRRRAVADQAQLVLMSSAVQGVSSSNQKAAECLFFREILRSANLASCSGQHGLFIMPRDGEASCMIAAAREYAAQSITIAGGQ